MKMHTPTNKLQRLGAFILNLGLLAGLSVLTFGLVSCGGSSSDSGSAPGNTTPTISSITPVGIVASSVPQTLSILGTNFASGMTLTISGSGIPPVDVTPTSISQTVIAGSATLSSAPADRYVTVTVKKSDGTPLVSTVLGVASTDKRVATGIQTIFDTKCATCHRGAANVGSLDLSDATLATYTGVIGIDSIACPNNFRVAPGDPRRTSSMLIDRIQAAPASLACNTNKPMPPINNLPQLTPQEINDLIDWVAGGAK